MLGVDRSVLRIGYRLRSVTAPRRRAATAIAIGLALAVTACGERDGGGSAVQNMVTLPPATTQSAEPTTTPPAEPPAPAASGTDTAPATEGELEGIVRAWSTALNADDNEAAADLFAPGAIVIQAGVSLRLDTRQAAIRWNEGLPCSGTIVDLEIREGVVIAVFSLGDRKTSSCDAAPGTLAAAAFLIEDGRIAVWEQVPPPEDAAPDGVAAPTEPAA
jgi:hypothetical protein